MCMPQSNIIFFSPIVTKIQLRPTSIYMYIENGDEYLNKAEIVKKHLTLTSSYLRKIICVQICNIAHNGSNIL